MSEDRWWIVVGWVVAILAITTYPAGFWFAGSMLGLGGVAYGCAIRRVG